MKAECDRCGARVELAFVPAPGGIQVACPACRAAYFVAATGSPAPRPGPGEQECPKCGEVQPRADACRRCGLVFVRWKGSAGSPGEDEEAARLWAAIEHSWDDPARHDAFLAYAQRTEQFSYAAGRYRAAQAARGAAAEPMAARGLERLEKLAFTTLHLSSRRDAAASGPMPYRNVMVLMAIAMFLLAAGLLWAIFRQEQRAAREPELPDRVAPVTPVRSGGQR